MPTMKPGSAPCFFHSFLHALAGLLLACAATPVIAATTVDSATVNGFVYSAATPYNATPSEVLSITINVTKSGGGNWQSYGATVGGAAWVAGTNCYNQTSPPNGTYSRSFTTAAPATAGTYDITFGTFTNNDCGGAGGSLTWTGAIVVAAPSSTTPTVVSINLASPDPTSPATLVDWTVTFNESVTGVDATDFALVEAGGATGASITGVSGGGTTWTVTANSGTGAGTLGLNLVDNDTIVNTILVPLGSAGAGNGNFTGQVYTVVYTAPGFVFTDSACTHGVPIGMGCNLVAWSPQIAGQNLAGVYITAVNTSGIPTRLHPSQDRTRDMEFGLSCHNPVANAWIAAAFAGATNFPLCQANGATPATWSSTVTVTFPGGSPSSNVPYTFNYADVGLVELWARNNATPSETGTSGAFVVKPGGFVLSNIIRTSDSFANPAAVNATGTKFVKAGEAFTVTVTATTIDGVTPTPNYGKETTPESVWFADVSLLPSDPNYANHGTLVAGLGLTSNPAIGGTFGAFTNGTATGTAFTWKEVGIINLTPSVGDGDYLGAGDVTGTASGNVGRFYAAQFALTNGVIQNRADLGTTTGSVTSGAGALTLAADVGVKVDDTISIAGAGTAGATFVTTAASVSADGLTVTLAANAATTVTISPVGVGSFTYMGEQMNASFTLTAKAVDGVTTLQNYATANNFAKFDPTAAGNPLGLGAVDTAAPTYLTARLDTSLPASGSFLVGSAAVVAPLAITRGAAADGPYAALNIGIAPADSDSVVMGIFDLDTDATAGNDHALIGTTGVRYGRLKLSNAHGSELLQLPINVFAQYWNSTTYLTNTLDNHSTFASTDVLFDNCQKNLDAGGGTCKPVVALASPIPPAKVEFTGGVASYRLAAPGAGNNGSVDMTVNVLSAYLPNITARATFGVYKGSNEFIYLRETY